MFQFFVSVAVLTGKQGTTATGRRRPVVDEYGKATPCKAACYKSQCSIDLGF